MWTKAAAWVSYGRKQGRLPWSCCLFSSIGLFIETMVEVRSWGCGGLKVLANGINYSPWRMVWRRRGAICLRWTWRVHGLYSTCRHGFKITAGRVRYFCLRDQFETIWSESKGRNAPFTLQFTERPLKVAKSFVIFVFGYVFYQEVLMKCSVGPPMIWFSSPLDNLV